MIGWLARWRAPLGLAASQARLLQVPPRDEPHFVRVERVIVRVRWLAIIVVAVAAPLAGLSGWQLAGTYAVVLLSSLYIGLLQAWVIERHPHVLAGGYLTSLAEAVLISLAVFTSGGAASPIAQAYFLVVVAAAVRFGFRASIVASALCFAPYLLVAIWDPSGAMPGPGELLLRFGFLIMTGMLAGYLAQEAQESRLALAIELNRTKELHRASSALAEENAQLSATLRQRLQDLERTQHQLIQSAKLAGIGELAANVAHEINNPLTAVLVNAELLDRELPPEDPHRADLLPIREEALRARGIVRNLLDFARQTPPTPELTDPRRILEGIIPLVQKRAALAGAEIVQSHAPDPLPIMVDVNQMKQVLINLLANAIDAMPDGGTIVIETGRQGDQVFVRVRDTGVGIPPEHRSRIFEPFFTTKPAVRGTGLGLSVSYGIVQRHGGTITSDSAPGQGATFTVWLPAAPLPARAAEVG